MKLADKGGNVELSESVFSAPYNEALVHQAVVAFLAGARQGSRKQKTRSEVSGGGAKPFRQKGTGRARAGTTRGPIWRTGGVTFAARPQDHSQKLNKKMYRGAIRSIFAELARTERLVVVEAFSLESPKTKAMVDKLASFDLDDALIILEGFDENVFLAGRNLKKVDVIEVGFIDPVSLVAYDKVVITAAALKAVEEWLS